MKRNPRYTTEEISSHWTAALHHIPDLHGAASTRYYRQCEEDLFRQYFGNLAGKRILKTDLWNEVRNTRIFLWAAQENACVFAVDIAPEIVQEAWASFQVDHAEPTFVVGDVRQLPFQDNEFDAVYSMGTIEHFPETATAIAEIFRVLRPGGTAIIGVPNKLDPFLRPLLVSWLNRLGLYAYGMEKSFTPRSLRRLLTAAGFLVTAQTGILFLPGWLRLLDLLCHTRFPRLARLTGYLIRPFAWLYRRGPFLRRHGYLTVCVAYKPVAIGSEPTAELVAPDLRKRRNGSR